MFPSLKLMSCSQLWCFLLHSQQKDISQLWLIWTGVQFHPRTKFKNFKHYNQRYEMINKKEEEEMKITKKSLLGMPSNREGLIQPSVTSQPPRLTAFTRVEVWAVIFLPKAIEIIQERSTKLSGHVLELKAILCMLYFVCRYRRPTHLYK